MRQNKRFCFYQYLELRLFVSILAILSISAAVWKNHGKRNCWVRRYQLQHLYLHYDSPDGVLREIQTEHSDRYITLIADYDYTRDGAALVRSFFEYMEAQDEFFKKVLRQLFRLYPRTDAKPSFIKNLPQIFRPTRQKRIRAKHHSCFFRYNPLFVPAVGSGRTKNPAWERNRNFDNAHGFRRARAFALTGNSKDTTDSTGTAYVHQYKNWSLV